MTNNRVTSMRQRAYKLFSTNFPPIITNANVYTIPVQFSSLHTYSILLNTYTPTSTSFLKIKPFTRLTCMYVCVCYRLTGRQHQSTGGGGFEGASPRSRKSGRMPSALANPLQQPPTACGGTSFQVCIPQRQFYFPRVLFSRFCSFVSLRFLFCISRISIATEEFASVRRLKF